MSARLPTFDAPDTKRLVMPPYSHEQFISSPPAEGRMARFLEGASAPFHGLRFLNRHPELWRYAILPTVLNLIITALAFTVLILAAIWLITEFHPQVTQGTTGTWWWLVVAAEIIAGILLLLVCAIVTVLTWKLLGGILCGYFYGLLAEQVERELGVGDGELRSISLLYEICDTLLNLTLLVVVNICILLLNVVPLVGGVLALLCSGYFTWYILGLDYLSFPLALRGDRRGTQFAFGHRHRMHTIGLGAVVFGLEFIPIAGAVLLTTAAVGSVLLHRRILLTPTDPPATRTPPPGG